MHGIAGVTARISEIEARIATLRTSSATSASSTVPAASPTGQSFETVLAGARAAAGVPAPSGAATALASSATASSVTAASAAAASTTVAGGRLTADGVPVDLAAYGNGRIPATALSSIGVGKHALWRPAADAFKQLSAAAAADGVTIEVTDSYRTYDQQVDLARRKGLYSQGGLAAAPGTSDHGWGRSVDLGLDPRAQQWMRANGPRYGFVEDVPREPWHWTFSPPA